VSDRRNWVERLSSGRTTSTAQPPSSRPEPGPGRPVRSNGPERNPGQGPGQRALPPPPAPEGRALRVLLVSRDNMLAGALRSLIEEPGGVRVLDWYSEELDGAIRHADVVIVDTPPALHERTFAVLGGRFLGRTVVLLQEGEHPEALPAGPPRAVLYRPVQIGELWTAIAGTAPPRLDEPEAEAAPAPEPEVPAEEVAEGAGVASTAEEVAEEATEEPAAAAAEPEAQGLPVAESGRLIGLSGQELDPVIGPGQVAPGMDEATFERLRGWGADGRQPAPGKARQSRARRRKAGREEARRSRAAAAETRREQARQIRDARAETRQAARERSGQARAAQEAARTAAREQAARERTAAQEQTRQAKAAQEAGRKAAREQATRSRAAEAEQRAAAREEARRAKAAQEAARRAVAEAEARQATAAKEAAARAADEERQARAEEARQAKAAKAEARAAAREEARREEAARAEERSAAREQARQARAEARTAAREEAGRAKAARVEARTAAREEAGRVKAAEAEARTAAREEARQAKAARAEARQAARVEGRQARAARAAEHREARAQARRAWFERLAAGRARRAEARQAVAAAILARRAQRADVERALVARADALRAERAEADRVAREAATARRAEQAAARRAAREEAGRARAARTAASRQARSEAAEARKAARAEARQQRTAAARDRREQSQQAKAARAETRKAAQAEAAQARAARDEARKATRKAEAEAREAARAEAAQRRAAQAEERKAAKEEAGRERAAKAEERRARSRQARVAKAEARKAALAETRQARAARAEARKAARAEAAQRRAEAREVARGEARQARAERAEAQKLAQAEAAQQRAAQAEERKAAGAEAAQRRAAQAEARKEARAEAARRRTAQVETRRAARAEAKVARREWARVRAEADGVGAPGWVGVVGAVARPVVVVAAMAAVGLVVAGWRGGGGPDTLAGEVAVVRAAGGSGGGLVVQDPRVGPIEPLHALAVGTWLRATEAGGSLEGVIREARVPSRVLLAAVVALTVLLSLLLMRVGPGSGAAAGPGPAPPQERGRPGGRWRLPVAALAGALAALDPALVRGGRSATGTILAVALALATLALAWGLPTRPTLRWLPPVAAAGGLALLVSPLALAVLAVPVVAELLQGRHREAWRDMAAVGLAIGLWLLLPVWVAGQGLGAGQTGWLLGRPPGRGSIATSLADAPLTWLLVAAGLLAAVLPWRLRSGARSEADPAAVRLLAWVATTAVGALAAVAVGYPASQALPFAVPAAAASLALGAAWAVTAAGGRQVTGRAVLAGVGLGLAGLLVAQGLVWGERYGPSPDDGLSRLLASVAKLPACSAINAAGPDDRARLLAAGATVTEFRDGPAAHAAGVRYFVLTGGTPEGGPQTPALAAWVRDRGTRLAVHPSRTLSGLELWRVDATPLDPVADSLPLADGVFSNVNGSACGGYRVVDGQSGSFYTAYRAAGGKAVLGRPLGTVWTSDGPALQAFDTMVLGAVAAASGPPEVRPIELPPLLAKLDIEAVADADIPLPSTRPPVTDRQARALLGDRLIARAYLGTGLDTATAEDWRRARERFGRPLGMPQVMPDGAVRQPFERVVLELPADGGPARPAALGRLAVRLGLVPQQAMRQEPVPGLPAGAAETWLDPGPLLRLVGAALILLALAAGAGAVAARRSRSPDSGPDSG
jgi:hypothetical protein